MSETTLAERIKGQRWLWGDRWGNLPEHKTIDLLEARADRLEAQCAEAVKLLTRWQMLDVGAKSFKIYEHPSRLLAICEATDAFLSEASHGRA